MSEKYTPEAAAAELAMDEADLRAESTPPDSNNGVTSTDLAAHDWLEQATDDGLRGWAGAHGVDLTDVDLSTMEVWREKVRAMLLAARPALMEGAAAEVRAIADDKDLQWAGVTHVINYCANNVRDFGSDIPQ